MESVSLGGHICGLANAYRQSTENIMNPKVNVKMLAIPRAKQRMMHSTPVLREVSHCV